MTTLTPASPGQPVKRRAILSIDGGGIRGVLTLQVLLRLEKELQRIPGNEGTLLADHFDLIAGTSVGGIFASLLALRMPVEEVLQLIAKNAEVFFTPTQNPWNRLLYYKFDKAPLEGLIKRTVGANTLLGDPKLKTRLLLVMRNASTDSPWIVSNSPEAPFNDSKLDDCNLRLPLWQLIRASAAAPYYFAPEVVKIGTRTFVFVDGAMTGFNNPSFKAFQYVTTGSYGLRWPAGEDRLSIVSVGTGFRRQQHQALDWADKNVLDIVKELPVIQISAADRETDVLCRTFGRCRIGDWIDYEVGDLMQTDTALAERLFTYYRMNVSLDAKRLGALGFSDVEPEQISRIDATENLEVLTRIGTALADEVFARNPPLQDMVRTR